MMVYRQAFRAFTIPFRAVTSLIRAASFLLVSAACILVAAFVSYAIVLTFSYAFLPVEMTAALWDWAADLYTRSSWFKAATIIFFMLLVLPILGAWPGRDPIGDAAHERKMMRSNEGLIAARRQEELQKKLHA
jgi:hypothetical protein